MIYCKTCKIKYNTPIEKCLFCNNKLSINNSDYTHMIGTFKYPEVKRARTSAHTFARTMLFLILVANIICIAIDIMDSEKIHLSWSLYPLVSSIYLLIIAHYAKSHNTFFHKCYCILLYTLLEVIAIGLISPSHHWAVDYIIPWGIIALNLISFFMIVGRKSKLYHYVVYVFATSLLGFIPLLLTLIKVTRTTWPSVTCYMYSIVTLLGLLFFSSTETKEELNRRFHL